jgi:hypothetical protein
MDELRAGMLVRVKEIPGTKLASKQIPQWAVITRIERYGLTQEARWIRVEFLRTVPGLRQTFKYLLRCHFDLPTDKQIPDWVSVEIAKRALIGENA